MNRRLPLLLLPLLLISCAGRSRQPAVVPAPDPLQAAAELAARGDVEFAKMHWTGWRNAVDLYQRSLVLKPDSAVAGRRFLACALISVRENELEKANPSEWLAKTLLEGENQSDPGLRTYARWLESALGDGDRPRLEAALRRRLVFLEEGETALPDDRHDPARTYLNLFFSQRLFTLDKAQETQRALESRFPDSPLAFFLHAADDPEKLDRTVAEQPDFIEARFVRATLRMARRRFSSALEDFQTVLAQIPTLAEACTRMGTIYVHLDDGERAMACFQEALRLRPLHPQALFGLALCLSEAGRYDESNAALRLMIDRQFAYLGEANYYLAWNHYQQDLRPEALAFATAARTYIPDSVELNLLAGVLNLDAGRPAEAQPFFLKVVELDPGSGDAHFHLGQIAAFSRRFDQARERFAAAAAGYHADLERLQERKRQLEGEEIDSAARRRIEVGLEKRRGQVIRSSLARFREMERLLGKRRRPPALQREMRFFRSLEPAASAPR